MRKEKKKIFLLAIALIVALGMTLLAGSGLLFFLDRFWNDMIIQHGSHPEERIAVIGIDAYAFDEIGEWPWDRSVMADVLEILNQDPEMRPAAIGLDVVYAGEKDEDSDRYLAEAAGTYDNVVAACTVEYHTEAVVNPDGSSYLDHFVADYPTLPYDLLKENAEVGHINAMYDKDGILRHHLWEVKTKDGQTFSSMPEQLYKKYCEYHDITPDYEPAKDGNGFWIVDFTAGPGDYYTYSAADILYGEYDPEVLAGAVVLIGPYEPSMSDDFLTAADRAEQMYGVEYLANVTSNLLSGIVKREAPDGLQLAILFLFTAGIICLFLRCNVKKMTVLFAVIMTGLMTGSFVIYEKLGWMIHSFWFFAAICIAYAFCIFYRYDQVKREKRKINKTFERYVDPAIIKELMKTDEEELALSGKIREIAVLFVDIRGFTTMSEALEPEQIVKILNRYLTLTSSCIKGNGGTLDKFIGDATMAFWGAPLPCQDPVYQACKAACQMAGHAKELEEELMKQFGRTVSFGIGIHYGEAVVGNIGAEDRMDYTAIGDTVNTASRLESNAPKGTIYISRRVADMLGERAVVTSLGNQIKLKGKSEGFEVLRLEELR